MKTSYVGYLWSLCALMSTRPADGYPSRYDASATPEVASDCSGLRCVKPVLKSYWPLLFPTFCLNSRYSRNSPPANIKWLLIVRESVLCALQMSFSVRRKPCANMSGKPPMRRLGNHGSDVNWDFPVNGSDVLPSGPNSFGCGSSKRSK